MKQYLLHNINYEAAKKMIHDGIIVQFIASNNNVKIKFSEVLGPDLICYYLKELENEEK